MKVCIDPGHGGTDPGASGNGFLEKDVNLEISLKLKDYLISKGIAVVLTRDSDITLQETLRVEKVKKANADICLSIHLNAATGKGKGVETIFQMNSQSSQKLAMLALDEISSLGIRRRRAYFKESKVNQGQDYYFMLRQTKPVTSVIVECLFIDNLEDIKFIQDADGIQKIASAIGDGILKYFGQEVDDWAKPYFDNLQELGILQSHHNTNDIPTWGELAAVISKTIDYLKKQ